MPAPDNDEATLGAMYRQMYRAMVAADVHGLTSLLAAEFHLVHMTGYDQPRAEWLAHIESRRMRYFSSVEESLAVQVDGDSATLTGCNRVRADIWGARGTWPLQLDIQLVRRDGRWLMSAAQAHTY